MPAVIDPKPPPNEQVRRETDEGREDERSHEERREPRPERRPGKGVPEVAVEQAVPRQVRDFGPVEAQELSAESVARREDGREGPRVSDELPEHRIDPVDLGYDHFGGPR